MKRLLTILLVVAMATPAFSQFETHRQRSRYRHNHTEHYYGLRLGLNIASVSSDVVESDLSSRTGLAFGGVFGLQLANATPVWLEAGLFYSEKGGETTFNNEKTTCRMTYLQLPIVCKYSISVYDDLFIQPFLGGYFALGLGGRTKEFANREAYDTFDRVNRFDGGLRLGCGAEYKMVYAELGFDLGLANISKGDFESARTRCFFINVGVNF